MLRAGQEFAEVEGLGNVIIRSGIDQFYD